jgi:hypothetical protein
LNDLFNRGLRESVTCNFSLAAAMTDRMPLSIPVPLVALVALAVLLFGCSPAAASTPRAPAAGPTIAVLSPAASPAEPAVVDTPIDAATRAQVIDTAIKDIVAYYVDPDVAAKLAASLRAHQAHGDYDHVTSSAAFALLLTAHFAEVAHDKHLGIRYKPNLVPADPDPAAKPDPAAGAAAEAVEREARRYTNCGFERVERLVGNIGYVKFNFFEPPRECGDVATFAMSFVADTDALILDLRDNIGGHPAMLTFLASYLFDGWQQQLSGIYWRGSGETVPAWTSSYVPGKRFGKDKPVYVLTSSKTVSAAEGFAYDLQAAKRATIVGEVTVGGANPGNIFRAGDHFRMQVAQGRAINPITKTNWEGMGVKPDIPVRAELALVAAELLALEGRADKTADPERKREIASATSKAREELERLKRMPAK